jgi:hypothetical protein
MRLAIYREPGVMSLSAQHQTMKLLAILLKVGRHTSRSSPQLGRLQIENEIRAELSLISRIARPGKHNPLAEPFHEIEVVCFPNPRAYPSVSS